MLTKAYRQRFRSRKAALWLLVAALLTIGPSRAQKKSGGSGAAGDTSGDTSGDQTSDASGKGGQQGKGDAAGAGSKYFVEADMLAYEASMQIAASIAGEIGSGIGKHILIYDQQTFASLQAYNAFGETVKIIDNGYTSTINNPVHVTPSTEPGISLSPTDLTSAAKTAAGVLTGLKSSTDYQNQKTDAKESALIAQVALALRCRQYNVMVPKILLLANPDHKPPADQAKPAKERDCGNPKRSISEALSCLYDKRAAAHSAVDDATGKVQENAKKNNKSVEVSSPELDRYDSLFDQLINALTGGKGTTGNDGGIKIGELTAPAPDKGDTQQKGGVTQNGPSLLATIIQGQVLGESLDANSEVLALEYVAAGGSYRIFHNFFAELFYRTPRPAFNGGSAVSYILFNPQNSTVIAARTLRFMFGYSKFKEKRLTSPGNLSAPEGKLDKAGPKTAAWSAFCPAYNQ